MNNKGITIVALIITVILLLILAGIGIGSGGKTLARLKLEEMRTNMLLIEAKAREYVENANFKLGIGTDDEKKQRIDIAKAELKGEELNTKPNYIISTNANEFVFYYKLGEEHLKEMGMPKIESNSKDGEYVIEYDIDKATIEVYNSKGYKKDNQEYHSLEDIKNLDI